MNTNKNTNKPKDCKKRAHRAQVVHANARKVENANELTVTEMQKVVHQYMPYVKGITKLSRAELCELVVPIMSKTNINLKQLDRVISVKNMLRYNSNSCYMDSLLTALFMSYQTGSTWVLDTFLKTKLPDPPSEVLSAMRRIYTNMRLSNVKDIGAVELRKALKDHFAVKSPSHVLSNVEWTREQNDPFDLLQAINTVLEVQPTIKVKQWTLKTKTPTRFMYNALMVDVGMLREVKTLKMKELFPKFPLSEFTAIEVVDPKGGMYIQINRNWLDEKKLKTNVVPSRKIEGTAPESKPVYLRAMLVHNGLSPRHGHYTAAIHTHKGWVYYDDMEAEPISIGSKLNDALMWKKSYIMKNMTGLLYVE